MFSILYRRSWQRREMKQVCVIWWEIFSNANELYRWPIILTRCDLSTERFGVASLMVSTSSLFKFYQDFKFHCFLISFVEIIYGIKLYRTLFWTPLDSTCALFVFKKMLVTKCLAISSKRAKYYHIKNNIQRRSILLKQNLKRHFVR